MTASIPSSAISRSVVCRSSRRRAPRPRASSSCAVVVLTVAGSADICTVRSYTNLSGLGEQRERIEADVVVIGGGIVGAATTLALARRGAAVALVEREAAGPAMGSSKGDARIFCPAPYPDESYLELGLRALERWRAIESQAGRELLVRTGALTTEPFAERAAAALRLAGQPAELLDADEVRRRFGVDTRRPDRAASTRGRGHPRRARPSTVLELAAAAGAAAAPRRGRGRDRAGCDRA